MAGSGAPRTPKPGPARKPGAAKTPRNSPSTTTQSTTTPGTTTPKPAGKRAPARRLRRVDEVSAGGLVLDHRTDPPQAALIARHDKRGRLVWSLPKGHVEEGETPEQAAIREVREETGIVGAVRAPLGVIDFWFMAEDKRIHKTVHHFLMDATGGELSDEDIEVDEVAWVPLPEVAARLRYADERKLLALVDDLLRAPADQPEST